MLSRSVFIFSCMCGCEFQREGKEAFHCPECGPLLVLEWRPKHDEPENEAVLVWPTGRSD